MIFVVWMMLTGCQQESRRDDVPGVRTTREDTNTSEDKKNTPTLPKDENTASPDDNASDPADGHTGNDTNGTQTEQKLTQHLSFVAWNGIGHYACALEHMSGYARPTLYLNPLEDGNDTLVANAQKLLADGAHVWSLISAGSEYPSMDYLQQKIDEITQYNQHHELSIEGMSFDIEPWTAYTDQNSSEALASWRAYLDFLSRARTHLREANLLMSVMAPWWAHQIRNATEDHRPVSQAIIDLADETVVMAYATTIERVEGISRPWLRYGDEQNRSIVLALEMTDGAGEGVSFHNDPESIKPVVTFTPIEPSFGGYMIHDIDAFCESKVDLQAPDPLPLKMHKADFDEDNSSEITNPDRGLYKANYELNNDYGDEHPFDRIYTQGYRLAYAPLTLKDYTTTQTLPDAVLEKLETNLADANQSGIKLIFRIRYRDTSGGEDPALSIIQQHFEQLKPLMQKYADVFSAVQAGTIGAWGEWHHFTGDFSEDNGSYRANRKAVIEELYGLFPDTPLQLRTPLHKEFLLGTSGGAFSEKNITAVITPSLAYSEDIRAHVGHHNDCVLASDTDMGTYPSDAIGFWKNYVAADARYVPVGGETCGIGEDEDARLSDCANAEAEFAQLHYTFLNDSYHPDVLQKWKDQGCYDRIKSHLGYRWVARSLAWAIRGDQMLLRFRVANRGYAPVYRSLPVRYRLSNDTDEYAFDSEIDVRKLRSGEEKMFEDVLSLKGIREGAYTLWIEIGDGGRMVRLANHDMWDANISANRLVTDIRIR